MKKRLELIFLILCLLTAYSSLSAQDHNVSGTVLDSETGEPIAGVNILIKGTSSGTVTDNSGQYTITAGSDAILAFSSVGYLTQEMVLGNQTSININLSPDIRSLDEVIVTGYSVVSRRQITGAVATVEPQDLMMTPTGNVEQMLQGRVSGVTVITNGQPGTTSQVRIRGFGALQGNQPLYVVDGVPIESIDFIAPGDIQSMTVLKDASAASIYGSRAAGGVIVLVTKLGNNGKPGMQVTYDGMVGVTVPGKSPELMNPQQQADWTWTGIRNTGIQNNTPPNYSSFSIYGNGDTPILPDWLEVGDKTGHDIGEVDLEAEAEKYNIDIKNPPLYRVVPANQKGTDWYDAMTRNALVHRHHIGLSGAGEENRYFVGLGVQEQQGTFLNQDFQRFTFRGNSEFDILPNLRFGENFQATYRLLRNIAGADGGSGSADGVGGSPEDGVRINGDWSNSIQSVYGTSPLIPVFDAFGGFGGSGKVKGISGGNPVAGLTRSRNNKHQTLSLFGNLYLEFEPLDGLVVRSSFGGQYKSAQQLLYIHTGYESDVANRNFQFFQGTEWQTQWVWTNTLNYLFELGNSHTFKLLIGQEALNTGTFRDMHAKGFDPISQDLNYVNLNTVKEPIVQGNHSNGINFSSYFGSVTYDFKNKYMASLVLRQDGASRFGKNNRWGTFPAVSVGWRLSEEEFMTGWGLLDDLRIRLGYGEMGNSNNVAPNSQFDLFGTSLLLSSYDIRGSNNSSSQGFYRTSIGNPSGSWETAVSQNIGLDATLWDAKVDISIDFWREITKDLLYQFPITVQTGASSARPFVNVGEMLNQGVDIRIGSSGDIAMGLRYSLDLIGSFLKNELVSLGPGIEKIAEFSIGPVINQVGHPISSFYGYQVVGLFKDQAEVDQAPVQEGAAPGRFRYRDISHQGIPYRTSISTEDRAIIGNPIPDFTGSVSLNLNYKQFELQLYGYASIGNEIYNIKKSTTDFFNLSGGAVSSRVAKSWTFENPVGSMPIFESAQNFSTNTQSHSYYIEDGSYFRMQNITLAYIIGAETCSRWGMVHMRIAASVNNLFTITDYSGLDPEVGGNLDHNFGIDGGNYPITRNWTIGVNIGF